jgi:two-component system sensor histidine kinase QseC
MIYSIRRFLFVSLFISISIASSITAIGNYFLDKQIIQPYLDTELIKIFTVIEKLNQLANVDIVTQKKIESYLTSTNTPHFMFQIWSPEGKLLFHSANSQMIVLKNTPMGFNDILINNEDWRAFSGIDGKTQTKIIVAELYDMRNNLTDLITRNNGYILLITYPIFAILIWIIVGLALRSVTKVTNEISNRASTFLEPVDATHLPIEIKPLVIELNQLFGRLKLAFERNKRFAADAAHELRTPLAALKTQAQVAFKANNTQDRYQALLKVMQGVDRSSHVVAQLLTLSRLSQEEGLNDVRAVDLHKIATEVVAHLAHVALEKNIDIEMEPAPKNTIVQGNATALGIMIRNIVDNAIRYTPEKGSIKISITHSQHKLILQVSDTGPGIPSELRDRVFERFYRGLGESTTGSGLGLAIVHQIAELHHATIRLSTPASGIGLQFTVYFVQ